MTSKHFRRKASQRGFIIAAPGYGSDSWMNKDAEKITNEMIDFLEKRLSFAPEQIYIIGASMGGGAALTYISLNSEKVIAGCDIFGVTDFVRFYKEGFYNKSIRHAFGGTPEQCPQVYQQRSGINCIDKLKKVPLLIIHGDRDNVVPIWNSKILFEKLKKAGGNAKLSIVRGVGHENAIINGMEDVILDFFENAKINK